MKSLKQFLLVVGVTLVSFFLLFILAVYAIFLDEPILTDAHYFDKIYNLIDLDVDDSAKIIYSKDTHGGFHGDGTLYIKVKLNDTQLKQIVTDIKTAKTWGNLPLDKEFLKISGFLADDFPLKLSNGYYYLHDINYEHLVKDGCAKKPIWNRLSLCRSGWNFVCALLDLDSKILYVYNLDT